MADGFLGLTLVPVYPVKDAVRFADLELIACVREEIDRSECRVFCGAEVTTEHRSVCAFVPWHLFSTKLTPSQICSETDIIYTKRAQPDFSGLGLTTSLRNVRALLFVSVYFTVAVLTGYEEPATAIVQQTPWVNPLLHARQAIREAPHRDKPASLDIDAILLHTPPTKFLYLFWSELSVAASMGNMDQCCRLATRVLITISSTSSSGGCVPPLMPVFVHSILASVIAR